MEKKSQEKKSIPPQPSLPSLPAPFSRGFWKQDWKSELHHQFRFGTGGIPAPFPPTCTQQEFSLRSFKHLNIVTFCTVFVAFLCPQLDLEYPTHPSTPQLQRFIALADPTKFFIPIFPHKVQLYFYILSWEEGL